MPYYNIKNKKWLRHAIDKVCGKYVIFLKNQEYIDLDKLNEIDIEKYSSDIIIFNALYDGDEILISNKLDRKYIIDECSKTGIEMFEYMYRNKILSEELCVYMYKKTFLIEKEIGFINQIKNDNKIKFILNGFINAKKINYIDKFLVKYRCSKLSSINYTDIINFVYSEFYNKKSIYLFKYYEELSLRYIKILDENKFYEERVKFKEYINTRKYKSHKVELCINVPNLSKYYKKYNNRKINLFYQMTFYQIIIATALALSKYKDDSNEIYIDINSIIDYEFINNLKKVFDKVYILDRTILNNGYNLEHRIYRKINDINYNIGNYRYNLIGCSNDEHLNVKYLIEKKLLKSGKAIHIEDGTSSYSNSKLDYQSQEFIKYVSENIGINAEKNVVLGTYSKIQEREVIFKNIVRDEFLDGKEINEINSKYMRQAIDILYADKLELIGSYNSKKAIINVDSSENFTRLNVFDKSEYISVMEQIVKILLDNNIDVYLKYHPREIDYFLDFLYEKFPHQIKIIDKNIPTEVLYRYKNTFIISFMSSSLFSFVKLRESNDLIISILNLVKLKGDNKNSYLQLKEKALEIGLKIPNDINEFIEMVLV